MATHKLTDGYVEALAADGRDRMIWDTGLPRLGLRVTPAGRRIYLVQYRAKPAPGIPSVTRKVTLGEHDGSLWNVTKARAAARKILGAVDAGGDPVADRQARAEGELQAKAASADAAARAAAQAEARERERFEVVVERYVGQAALKAKRSGSEVARLLRQGPAVAWEGRRVGAIRRLDVADLIDTIRERSPATARLTYAALRGLFTWCIERELVEISPCDYVKAPPRPPARDRVLSESELKVIWQGAGALGFPFGPIIKLLMLTGQREAEVAGMGWEEIDLAAATWTIPKERTKNGREHVVDLSIEALEIIEAVPRTGELLFPRRRAPARKHVRDRGEAARPVVGFSAAKRLLDGDVKRKTKAQLATADLAPWRFHDLRRTAATGMAGMGFPPHVVERVLNHSSGVTGGLVGVYQRHEYRAERRAALTAWGARVESTVTGRPVPSNVTALRA
jgi:integrase